MATQRKWRVWNLPTPDDLNHIPEARATLRDWLAGMGPKEMSRWVERGGWIPPELAEIFNRATAAESMVSRYTVPIAVLGAGPSSKTPSASTAAQPREGRGDAGTARVA